MSYNQGLQETIEGIIALGESMGLPVPVEVDTHTNRYGVEIRLKASGYSPTLEQYNGRVAKVLPEDLATAWVMTYGSVPAHLLEVEAKGTSYVNLPQVEGEVILSPSTWTYQGGRFNQIKVEIPGGGEYGWVDFSHYSGEVFRPWAETRVHLYKEMAWGLAQEDAWNGYSSWEEEEYEEVDREVDEWDGDIHIYAEEREVWRCAILP